MCLEGRSLGWGTIKKFKKPKKNRSFFWNLRVSLHSSMRCNLQGTAHRWSATLPPVSNILYLLQSCWCTSRSPTCHKMDLLRFHPPKFNHSHRSTSLWDTSFKTDKTGRSEDHWKRPVLNSVLLLAAPSHQSLANRELKKMLSPSLSLWKQSTFQHRNCIFQFFRFSNHENTWGKSCHLSPPSFLLFFFVFLTLGPWILVHKGSIWHCRWLQSFDRWKASRSDEWDDLRTFFHAVLWQRDWLSASGCRTSVPNSFPNASPRSEYKVYTNRVCIIWCISNHIYPCSLLQWCHGAVSIQCIQVYLIKTPIQSLVLVLMVFHTHFETKLPTR